MLMSEPFYKDFQKRKEQARELPVVKIELTMGNCLLQKYDVIVIHDQCYIIVSRPIRTESGFTYIITPYREPHIMDNTATLVDTILPEF